MKRRLCSSFVACASLATVFVFASCAGSEAVSGGGGSTGTGGAGGAPAAGTSGAAGTVGEGGRAGTGFETAGTTGTAGTIAIGGRGGEGVAGQPAGTSGSAGTSGLAGRGGTGPSGTAGGSGGSGTPGNAGAGGSTGAGGGGPATTTPSAGCDKTTSQALNQWVDGMVSTGGSNRPYAVRLPTGYDPNRAYPVILLLHGCTSGTNNVPMEKVTGSDAILVRGTGSAADTCWNTAANGPDVAFVDAMIADTKARFCADESRFFVVGYSSGSWLANQLTCIRSSVLRGAASVTGGEAATGTCKGPVSRIFIHDKDDTTNVISGSIKARDRQLTQNGCDKTMQPVPRDPSPCVGYPGCPAAYPVVWCETTGRMHDRQDNLAPSAFWNFFKSF